MADSVISIPVETNVVNTSTVSVTVTETSIPIVVSIDGTVGVVTSTQTNNISTEVDKSTTVVSSGEQGPQGIPGDSINYVNLLSGQALSGHKVVSSNNLGYAVYADSTVADTGNKVLGITTGAVSNGSIAQIQIVGVLEEPTWSWNLIDPIFIGTNGQLTQTPPETGYLYIVAFPMTPTKIFIDKQPPIMLG